MIFFFSKYDFSVILANLSHFILFYTMRRILDFPLPFLPPLARRLEFLGNFSQEVFPIIDVFKVGSSFYLSFLHHFIPHFEHLDLGCDLIPQFDYSSLTEEQSRILLCLMEKIGQEVHMMLNGNIKQHTKHPQINFGEIMSSSIISRT